MNDYDWYCFCFITGTISSAQQLNLNSFNSSRSNSLKPAAVKTHDGQENVRRHRDTKETEKKGGREGVKTEGRVPTADIPSPQGVPATLRNEAISLMEASLGLTSCSDSPVPVHHTITTGPAVLKSNHSSG